MITLTIESLIVSILLERENLKLVLVDEYFVSENELMSIGKVLRGYCGGYHAKGLAGSSKNN